MKMCVTYFNPFSKKSLYRIFYWEELFIAVTRRICINFYLSPLWSDRVAAEGFDPSVSFVAGGGGFVFYFSLCELRPDFAPDLREPEKIISFVQFEFVRHTLEIWPFSLLSVKGVALPVSFSPEVAQGSRKSIMEGLKEKMSVNWWPEATALKQVLRCIWKKREYELHSGGRPGSRKRPRIG